MSTVVKLQALAVIAAGLIGEDSPEIVGGTVFEVDGQKATELIEAGLAKEYVDQKKAKTIKVRVLVDSAYGRPNDVVEIPQAEVKGAEASGFVDSSKEAVAYAESLTK